MLHRDVFGLSAFRLGHDDLQDTFLVFGLDVLGIDLRAEMQRPTELARVPFHPVPRLAFLLGLLFALAGDPQIALPEFDVEVFRVHSGQLNGHLELLLCLREVDARRPFRQPVPLTSFKEAVDLADELNTPVMLFFSGSDWCPWTRKLKQEVFDTSDFAAWSDSRVVTVMVDFPRKSPLPTSLANQNNSLLNRYRHHLKGFPTALFIKPDGTVVGKMGYEPDGLLTWIHKAQKIVGKLDKVASAAGRFTVR